MSMAALCLASVSLMSTGSAYALICWSLPLPFGYCRTETSVILPLATITWTWTGPHCVSATSPCTVAAVGEGEAVELGCGVPTEPGEGEAVGVGPAGSLVGALVGSLLVAPAPEFVAGLAEPITAGALVALP